MEIHSNPPKLYYGFKQLGFLINPFYRKYLNNSYKVPCTYIYIHVHKNILSIVVESKFEITSNPLQLLNLNMYYYYIHIGLLFHKSALLV